MWWIISRTRHWAIPIATMPEDIEETDQKYRLVRWFPPEAALVAVTTETNILRRPARFIIEKDKAIHRHAAACVEDRFQPCCQNHGSAWQNAGVVGEEEGTKPRKVLMSMEQFEQLLEEI